MSEQVEQISIAEELGISEPVAPQTNDQAQSNTQVPINTENVPEATREPLNQVPQPDDVMSDFVNAFTSSIKEQNPEFSLPEDFAEKTPQEKAKILQESLSAPSDDPFTDGWKKAKSQGLTPDQYVKSFQATDNIKNMKSTDFLFSYLKEKNGQSEERPEGWSDEDISKHINSMDKVQRDLIAEEKKEEVLKRIEESASGYKDQIKQKIRQQSEEINQTKIKDTVDKLFSKMSSFSDIGGIPHTESERAEFREVFADLVSINPETGYSRARELFSDDEKLYRAAYFLYKDQGNGLKKWLSEFKEGYKQEVLDKTRLAPRKEGGQSVVTQIPTPEDMV